MILKAIGPGILPVKNTMIEIFHENTIHWDQNDFYPKIKFTPIYLVIVIVNISFKIIEEFTCR